MTDAERIRQARALQRRDIDSGFERLGNGDPMTEWGGRGYALEFLLLRGFALELGEDNVLWPRRVTGPGSMGTMEQNDGVIFAPFATFLVECKCTRDPLDVEPLAKLRFRLEGRPPGLLGLLVSFHDDLEKSGFTEPAEFFARFASPLNILLWMRRDFDVTVTQGRLVEGLKVKWRLAVEKREAIADLATHYQRRRR